jgi:hypothetical protein
MEPLTKGKKEVVTFFGHLGRFSFEPLERDLVDVKGEHRVKPEST